jgi:hypothetical protein
MRLTTHVHLVPRLRMHGVLPPLPDYVFMAWWLVKHRDYFTLPLLYMKSVTFRMPGTFTGLIKTLGAKIAQ